MFSLLINSAKTICFDQCCLIKVLNWNYFFYKLLGYGVIGKPQIGPCRIICNIFLP